MAYFHSKDPDLAKYNGKQVTEVSRWYEGIESGDFVELWEVVEVMFEETGEVLTCWPSEVLQKPLTVTD